jgi:peptidoglycan hydrolase-like protein with peptidoglycan-binding domain
MKTVRAALLVLLASSVAGLGVPASYGQAAKGSKSKATPGKKTSGHSLPTKSAAKKASTSTGSARAKDHSTTTTSKKSPARPAGKRSTSGTRRISSKSTLTRKGRKQHGQKAPATDRVIEIQAALARNGSLQGEPTGKWDDSTSAAMRRFQASHGLNATGKLDAPTLQRLGLGSEIAGVAAPTPPPGATSRLTSSTNVFAEPTESGRPQ